MTVRDILDEYEFIASSHNERKLNSIAAPAKGVLTVKKSKSVYKNIWFESWALWQLLKTHK